MQNTLKKLYTRILPHLKLLVPLFSFAGVVLAIVLMFPNKTVYKYEYAKGQPWQYDDLISSFDFPVYKSETVLKREKDSIRDNQIDYYRFSDQPGERAVDLFREDILRLSDLGTYSKRDSLAVMRFADEYSGRLQAIYGKGIIRAGMASKSETLINVFKKGMAVKSFVGDFYTEKQAFMEMHRSLDSLEEVYRVQLPNLPVERYIAPNVEFDKANTERMLNRKLQEVSPVTGMIKKGERIISKGEPVDNQNFIVLESLKAEYELSRGTEQANYMVALGHLLLLLILFSAFYFYLRVSEPDILINNRQLLYLLISMLLFTGITALFVRFVPFDVYLIPYAILPVLTVNFHNVRLAVFHHTITILIISFFVAGSIEFIFTQLVVGYVAAVGVSRLQNRRQILQTVGLIMAVFILSYISFSLLREGDFNQVDWAHIAIISVSSVFVLISYPLIYLFERIFGYLSNISLLEMSDLNHPLLKKLSENAPGTFQHSLQVANIAEAVAAEIGGNPLLARTGALYHDVGKMREPQFFIENQHHGYNPHSKIKPTESAGIIKDHVTNGVRTARKYNIPETIIEFIRTHHGTGIIQYFLHAERTANPEAKVDESKFTYPGPRPRSKEAAIVMFTDSVEAASRSLKEISEQSVDNLVEAIVEKQIKAGQTQEADITFAEIAQVKRILKEKIKNIYHTRIEYPEEE